MRHTWMVVVVGAGCAAAPDDAARSPAPVAVLPGGAPTVAPPPGLVADSAAPVAVTWDRGRPRLVTGAFLAGGEPVAAARAVLARHAADLRVDAGALALRAVRRGVAGSYVRFEEVVGGLPVFGGEVVVLVDGAGAVRTINLAHRGPFAAPGGGPDVGPAAALAAVRGAAGVTGERGAPGVELGIRVDAAGRARRAYRVTVLATAPRATWRAFVDAATGAVDELRDLRVRATGSGRVFDPNAVDSTGDTTLTDGNDATTPALNAARFTVALPNLDGSGVLRGTWVDVKNLSTRATDAGLSFVYNRAADEFEEVMVYFHIDRVQQRVQDLGFVDADNRVQVATVNAFADDNSFYDPGTKEIEYGDGGVDDAEDGDIVIHEYGHSMQDDQVPGWGGGDEGAMGEGFGDYLGGGFESTLAAAAGHPGMVDPACVGEWDATSYASTDPPCLRRLDGTKHYPEASTGEVHDDGEIWSSGLWQLRGDLGADHADTLVIEHHFALSTSETFDTASAALIAADQALDGGAHATTIRRALYARGLYRTPQPGVPGLNQVETLAVSVENPTSGGIYADDLDDTRTVTFPGATAVRVHFTQVELEENSACLAGACDYLYLSDPAGDLYQIVSGTATDTVSVVIPGDTAVLRLVTDGSVGRLGYHVDRVDRMDSGPGLPDAAPGTPDAGTGAPDAAGTADAGGNPATPDAEGGGMDGGGCCSGSGGGASAPLALGVLALVLRRRRRPAPR